MKNIYCKLIKKDNINMIRFINIVIFIFFSVFLNNSFHKFFYFFYLVVSFGINFIAYKKKYISINRHEVVVFFSTILFMTVSYFFGFKEIYNVLASFLFLSSCYLDFYKNEFEFSKKYKNIYNVFNYALYIVITIFLIYDLIYHFCFFNFKIGMDYNLLYIGDKNYSGIIVFLFF